MIEGLKACCAVEGRYNEPFRFEMGGAAWVGATNGHVMAAIETSDAETLAAATGASPGDKGVAGALAVTDEGWQPVSLSALRGWSHDGPRTAPCDHCEGTRRLTCAECDGKGREKHDCDCSYCHVVDDGPCEECDVMKWHEHDGEHVASVNAGGVLVLCGVAPHQGRFLAWCVVACDGEALCAMGGT